MAAQNALFFSLDATQISLDGLRVTGWGASDGLQLTPVSELFSITDGADGVTTHSALNNSRWTGTFTVGQATQGARTLYDLCIAQHPKGGASSYATIALLVNDTINGTRFSGQMVFMRWPDMPFNREAGEYVFNVSITGVEFDFVPNLA